MRNTYIQHIVIYIYKFHACMHIYIHSVLYLSVSLSLTHTHTHTSNFPFYLAHARLATTEYAGQSPFSHERENKPHVPGTGCLKGFCISYYKSRK
jgi:hypothetical protein